LEPFELHTTLGQHHRQIMDSFAEKSRYGNRRVVLERALELLNAVDDEDVERMLYVHKFRNSMMQLFNFVMLSGDILDSIVNAVLNTRTTEKLLNNLVESAVTETKTIQKVLGKTRVNTFSDMVKTLGTFHEYLNVLGEASVDEESRQISAKINVLRPIPELMLEILNAKLEASNYTFDIRIENERYSVLVVHWIPPEDYPRVKRLKEERLRVSRQNLIATLSGTKQEELGSTQ